MKICLKAQSALYRVCLFVNFVSRETQYLKLVRSAAQQANFRGTEQAVLLIYFPPPLLNVWLSSYVCFLRLANTTPSMIAIIITADAMKAKRYFGR
jgi:hypothetical protein